jgi:release factor glutamine methyltransferase
MSVLDVGTGSGAIAFAVRRARPDVAVTAVDVSPRALEVARRNAARLDLDVTFVEGDLRQGLKTVAPGPHVAVAANLPYVPRADLETLAPEVARFEPRLALDGGEDGLELVRALVSQAMDLLVPGGNLLLEVGIGQAEAVRALCGEAGLTDVAARPDLGGILRVVRARRP